MDNNIEIPNGRALLGHSASAGRSAMLIMFGIRFLRWPTFRDGRRTARPVLKHLVSSCFRAPRDCTYSD